MTVYLDESVQCSDYVAGDEAVAHFDSISNNNPKPSHQAYRL